MALPKTMCHRRSSCLDLSDRFFGCGVFQGQDQRGQRSSSDRHEVAPGSLDAGYGGGLDGQHMPLADTADKGVCLPARMAAAHRACVSTQGTPQEGSGCARNAACMVPVLREGDQMLKVVSSSPVCCMKSI